MYDKTVTVFNYYESKTLGTAYWYPHILPGVDLNIDHGAILKKYGQDSTDNAQLHVKCYMHATEPSDDIWVIDSEGQVVLWLPPKEWAAQINDELAGTITFSEDSIFWQGEWTQGIVTDDDYRGGFYQWLNSHKDNVFKVTSVGGPYTLIPHFEILGK